MYLLTKYSVYGILAVRDGNNYSTHEIIVFMSRKKITPHNIVKNYARHLAVSFHIAGVYLFGSAARKTMTRNSDIDVIILSKDFQRMSFMRRAQLLNLKRSGSALDVSMDIIGLTPEEFRGFRTNSSPHLKKIYQEARRVAV